MAFSGAFRAPFAKTFDAGLAAAAGNGLLNNLVAYWPLNEAAGANNALDLHSNGLTLTQTASPGSAAGVVYAGARTFNGSTQYFSRASENLLQLGDVDFTFFAWVYLASLGAVRSIVSKVKDANNYEFLFGISSSDKGIFDLSATGLSTGEVAVFTPDTISPNAWTALCVYYDSVADSLSIAINNGTPGTLSHAGGVGAKNARFDLGHEEITAYPYWWNGRIGPVAFWKSAAGAGGMLSSSQRSALYNSGAGLAYAAFTT